MTKITVEESNLICIYNTGALAGTLAELRTALPFIDDPDMLRAKRRVPSLTSKKMLRI